MVYGVGPRCVRTFDVDDVVDVIIINHVVARRECATRDYTHTMTTMTTMTMMRASVGSTRGGATARRGATVVSRASKAPTTVEYVMVDARERANARVCVRRW